MNAKWYQTCHDDRYRRTVNTVNRNPVIERIVPTASPIDLATIADVCDVDDSMEERPLFPATRSCFRLLAVSDESLRLCRKNLLSRPRLGCTGFVRSRLPQACHSSESGNPGPYLSFPRRRESGAGVGFRSACQRCRPFPRKRLPRTIFERHSETA
jgi:hypothetical protein